MIFNSIIYFLFLAFTLLLFYTIPARFRNYLLIIASAFFYMYVKVSYIFIILFIIVANYLIGIAIEKAKYKSRKLFFLNISLFINLGILIFFKYWDFLIWNVFTFFGLVHNTTTSLPILNLILPLGLSYYTFQTIGYILDVYRGTFAAERNFSQFALFTLFFPKLLVGPIERAKHFLPQLKKQVSFNKVNITEGAKRIAWGLFKKLVVADRIALYHNLIIGTSERQSGSTILFASILYTFQVYADFSGYTDIALGTARMFGYDLMENFKRPLLAKNVSDFWRRWHISLSSWVNDYIFNPVVFRRRDWGIWGVFYGLVISFVVIGIWHGAAWNYVLFGLLQAMALIYEVITRKARKRISKQMPSAVYNTTSILLTFMFVTFSLIIFESPTISDAAILLKRMFVNPGPLFYDKPSTILFIIIGCATILFADIEREFRTFKLSLFSNKNWAVQQICYALLLIYILLAGVFDGGQFIYFSF